MKGGQHSPPEVERERRRQINVMGRGGRAPELTLMTAKATSGAMESERGHSTSIEPAEMTSEKSKVLTAPSLSHMNPHERRPTALEKLKPATRPAPALPKRGSARALGRR
jgi:hypothetical protein